MNTPNFRFSRMALLVFLLASAGCAVQEESETPETEVRGASLESISPDPFGDYWYQGEAEITSYELEQARYGSMHDGEAVLIFVTERFLENKAGKTG